MKISVADPDLDFLTGGAPPSKFPVRVVRAARRKYDLLRAVPQFDQVPLWKSFDYRAEGRESGSVSVLEDWRFDLRGEQTNDVKDAVTLTRMRNVAHGR